MSICNTTNRASTASPNSPPLSPQSCEQRQQGTVSECFAATSGAEGWPYLWCESCRRSSGTNHERRNVAHHGHNQDKATRCQVGGITSPDIKVGAEQRPSHQRQSLAATLPSPQNMMLQAQSRHASPAMGKHPHVSSVQPQACRRSRRSWFFVTTQHQWLFPRERDEKAD